MKAFIVDHYSENAPLRAGELPDPVLQPDEVLVEVHAASVNPLDFKIRNGDFKLLSPARPPFALGHDLAGVVLSVGARVHQFKKGDEVYASPDDFQKGTFAQYVAVKESALALKPKNLSMAEAASIPLVALTAWQLLVDRAKLRPGQKIFIQAGSGGVGSLAIQLAKHLGSTVASTTSAANIGWVKALGADLVIDYKNDDFAALLSDYDVVLNSQDSQTLKKSLGVLKPGGQLISISGPPDPAFAVEIKAPWWLKQIMRALSFPVRAQAKKRNVAYSFLYLKSSGAQLQHITTLIEAGVIKPVIDRVFAFESTNEALAYVERGRAKGKVVITLR